MKTSIKWKLFFAIIALIALEILVVWIFNARYLEEYYYDKKENALKEAYRKIDTIYKGSPEEVELQLDKLERREGIRITILNKNFDVIYSAIFRPVEQMNPKPNAAIVRKMIGREALRVRDWPQEGFEEAKLEKLKRGETLFQTQKDKGINTEFIYLISRIGEDDFVIISASVAAIQDSAEIANRFFLLTGGIGALLASFVVFLLAGRVTKPILKLNQIAHSMAKLDFSKKFPVRTRDEIGELGGSINSLSEQLEKSITELREANLRLQGEVQRERELDEMRKGFISSVSHELKTPISLIQGYAEGLKVNVNSSEEDKNEYCEVIIDEAEKMDRMVKQLLDLAQMEAGVLHVEKERIDISELIARVLRRNQVLFNEKEIRIEFQQGDPEWVEADPVRVEQVLNNYLSNAINHIDESKHIRVWMERKNEVIRICVYNSGRNIPEEAIGKIWISFYKVDKARTRAYGGTGLGLSVVSAIQQAHGNACGVENRQGGVVFWFELTRVL